VPRTATTERLGRRLVGGLPPSPASGALGIAPGHCISIERPHLLQAGRNPCTVRRAGAREWYRPMQHRAVQRPGPLWRSPPIK
jgi:hypothetical protein